jgi:hypothetical protein
LVNAIAVQDDGKIVIGGSFVAVNDVPRTNIARLNPNGSVDLTWNANLESSGLVSSIAAVGSNIYVGGDLHVLDDPSRYGLVRLSSLDGSTDTNWGPKDNNPSLVVNSVAATANDVYVGGSFTSIGGLARSNLARLSGIGSGAVSTNWNPGANQPVTKIIVSSNDLFVAGAFSSIGGQSRSYLAKLGTTNGAVDTDWDPQVVGGMVRDLAVTGTNLYLRGSFTNIGGFSLGGLAKLATSAPARVDTNWGSPFPSFVGPLAVIDGLVFTTSWIQIGAAPIFEVTKVDANSVAADPAWRPTFQSAPIVMQATPAGLFVGGQFSLCNGQVSLALAKLDLVTGARDSTFTANVQNPGAVYAVARQQDGKVIVGGDFWFAGGLSRQNLARINQDGSLDRFWTPAADAPIYSLALSGTNVFVGGGGFLPILAKLTTEGSGAADTNWRPGGFDGFVYALAVGGTNLFVGGAIYPNMLPGIQSGVAKLNTTDGRADTNWPGVDIIASVFSLALNGTNLYVGGSFDALNGISRTNLAKLSALSGAVDTNWDASIARGTNAGSGLVQTLAVCGTDLFVGGNFTNIGGLARKGLGRVSLASPAVVNTNWNPLVGAVSNVSALACDDIGSFCYVGGSFALSTSPYQSNLCKVSTTTGLAEASFPPGANDACQALLVVGDRVYAGGSFSQMSGASRYALALLTVAHAPQLIQDNATNLFVFPNAADGPEITHFQILTVTGGTLHLSDGITQVNPGDFITVAQGSAGLRFVPGATLTAVAALNNTAAGAGTGATTLTMVTDPAPVFKFSAPTYSAVEGQQTYIVITVRKYGSGAASVNYGTFDITAIGGVDYQPLQSSLSFSATDKAKNLIIAIAYDLQPEPDRQFGITLWTIGGTYIVIWGTAVVTIVEEEMVGAAGSLTATQPPGAPPDSSGSLTISLLPTNAQWRLLGELNWHPSGATVSGLITGNYGIEFRPVSGYLKPQPVTVPISAGATNSFPPFVYAATTNLARGNLSVLIEPDDVATNADPALRGQWHREGDSPANWFNSGDVLPNLSAGSYTVEFKAVPGRLTPPSQLVQVGSDATYSVVAAYLIAAAASAQTPVVVPFYTATTNPPYLYNGQIETGIGFSSGFVVQQRVVLTAAHALFDDVLLSYVTEVRWFFQRYRDQLEPPPQIPRGWYIFDGYAAQRQVDNSPGISTPASQDLDAAGLFFLEDAGRGGYGGYLSDDAHANQYLLSANNKFLAGYPLDGVAQADQGKLFTTPPANLNFTRLYTSIFATTNIASYPGNSGGPLYVQSDVDQYLPAAIYLGGSGQTLVRAINSEVVDLINRAEISGNGGGNSTGGGVSILSPGITAAPFGESLLIISLNPSNATHALPGWRIAQSGDTNYVTDAVTKVGLVAGGDYDLEFRPVPGFVAPSNRVVTAVLGQVISLSANYVPISPSVGFNASSGLSLSGSTGATYRVEYASNLTRTTAWTPLSTQTLASTSTTIPNTMPTRSGQRFYRAVLVP